MTASGLRIFVLMAGALMVGAIAQAQQAPHSSSSTASSPPTAAQPAQNAAADNKPAAAQPTRTAAAQKPDDSDAQLIRDARNAGFKPETIRGTQMFCRTATELGSRFPVRTCYDADQVKIKIHEYQVQRNEMEAQHNTGLFTH